MILIVATGVAAGTARSGDRPPRIGGPIVDQNKIDDAVLGSVGTVHSYGKGSADLTHSGVGQTPQPANQD